MGQKLRQELRLESKSLQLIISQSQLLTIPDEVLNFIAGAISYNPNNVEAILKDKKSNPSDNYSGSFDAPEHKVRMLYSSLTTPSKGEDPKRKKKGGLILSPDIRSLEGSFENYFNNREFDVTPDVTYIGRRGDKPEIVYSDHIRSGLMTLGLLLLDPSIYPETSRLIKQLTRFDEWKKRVLRDVYILLGGYQREFFEDFDKTKLNLINQMDLANRINADYSSISRMICNRWVEARNVSGKQDIFYTKDLLATSYDLMKYSALPLLNKILEEEFKNKIAYSDYKIREKIPNPNLARRTVAKYRGISGIPCKRERKRNYESELITKPYRFV
ncbi:hypothetical protein J4406_02675 [Candidatus Woesearchaeota archaeon]|nr:hypothetical protein [Candidatus Woesearchaeota archaeon]